MGPTAAGKTALVQAFYETGQYELISVDSVLTYRGLDIGSAKPGPQDAPHALVDIRDFWQTYSAGEFRADCLAAIYAAHERGKRPLLVGGTQMYYKALLDFESGLPAADQALREQLRERAAEFGWASLHAELAKVDPITAARLHPNHSSRIERALEVFQLTGQPLSDFHAKPAEPAVDLIAVGLLPEQRAWLHQRIEARVHQMMEMGFEDELRGLMASPHFDPSLTALMSVGYRQGFEWLAQGYNRATFVERAVIATRQLAKRQLTWLRSWPDLKPVAAEQASFDQVQAAFFTFE